MAALQKEAEGMELHLCPTSQSGYKGVWNTGKKNLRYEAAAGSHRLGRFETAVDAAVCYAKYTASGAEAASKWAAPAAGLVTEAEGLRLHLAAGTATGYAGVWTTGKVARPFEAVAGGKRIGRFASVVDAAVCYARHLESGPAAAREWLAACDAKSAEAQRADSDKKREEAVASCAGKGLQTEYKGVQLHLAPGSKTGYAGVWLNGRGSGYRVALEQNGSRRDLGRFNDVLEAALAYAQYERSEEGQGS
ncbi:hypothetical protein EMIHUDRAFT_454128 [Emiliania huxleyi CCMP1516]|uniref:AP2/ERF domain-containing protein n=2 Tax=Emiliania huxleyi TaxID=2903 RepID=A0A0D3KYR9_EMIH1|nr:hypothetical protein EMIHUDRAFT_454128 [Emiliania huxleyi CCMP1516]EOD40904.1 hypothetical protein EMIHUDRAFT_454128 [Emiliania huxleyi CCMP1516]|eukprot:XP_005793333.1 hypothetical protein EMIHUDRAFT_454128 [Emiliania huxleyi CCMP1516]